MLACFYLSLLTYVHDFHTYNVQHATTDGKFINSKADCNIYH
jgi:hypothetical protein